MAAPMDLDDERPARPAAWRFVLGLASVVVVLVALLVPVVVMLLLPPRGFPTTLPDALALALLAGAGVVVGFTARVARHRPPLAITLAVLLGLLALWYQSTTWLPAGGIPIPPILPNVPPTLVLAAGVFVTTAVMAVLGSRRRQPDVGTDTAADGPERGWTAPSVALGAIAAVVVVVVVEGDIWGRQRLRETFQGPWGLSLFDWLALLFVAVLVIGALLGSVINSANGRRASSLAVLLLAVAVLLVWVVAGLDGPPRTTLYGLSLGLLALGAVAPRGGGARRRRDPYPED